jgi:HEAT repeat protein
MKLNRLYCHNMMMGWENRMEFLIPLFGVNIEKLKKQGNVKKLIKLLGYQKHFEVRVEAAKALGEIGDPQAVKPLIPLLRDSSKKVREAVTEVLIRFGSSAVEPLIFALKDRSKLVRGAAAEVLGEIGDPLAVQPLSAAINDNKWDNVQEAVARALGKIKDPSTVELLIAVALEHSQNSEVTKAAVAALKTFDSLTLNPLITALKNENQEISTRAMNILDELGWQPDQSTQGATYWIVRKEWDRCVQIGSDAVAPLIIALKDSSYQVRSKAAWALGQIGDPQPQVIELLITALTDRSKYVREAAEKALNELGWQPDQSTQGATYWIVKKEWDRCVQIGPDAVAPLIAALNGKDEKDRRAAVDALAKIGDSQAVTPLISKLTDNSSQVRLAAADALEVLGWLPEEYTADIKFNRHYKLVNKTYVCYTADDPEIAKKFLAKQKIKRNFFYIEVETPCGTWGRDINGLYLLKLLSWQTQLDLAECEGDITKFPTIEAIEKVVNNLVDNYLVEIACGKCSHKWWDGIQHHEATIVRCPKCQTYNKISGSKINIMSIKI